LIVQRAIAHMRAHLDAHLSLEELAKLGSTSKFHFVRLFEDVTGSSPHRYLTCLRLQRAKALLLNSDLSVMDICLEVGYSSHGSFSKTFAWFVGISPSEFRALARELDHWELANRLRSVFSRLPRQLGREMAGEVNAPRDLDGSIFVGVFGVGSSTSMPHSSMLLSCPGRFRISLPATREFQLMAVHIPGSARLAELLCNPPVGVLIANQRLSSEAAVRHGAYLRLQPWLPKGRPPLAAMPALSTNFAISEKRQALADVMH
jgi:AraC-like DNA-binding protein